MVNIYSEAMLLISNFPPNKVTIDVSAGGDDQFTPWQGPRIEASWAQGDQLPYYCRNQNSFCSLVLRHSYEKPGNYTVAVRLRGLLPVESFNISAVFSVSRKESLREVLGEVVFVSSGPSYPGRPIQFLLTLERVSPDLQVRVSFADYSVSVLDVKSPNATLPSWSIHETIPTLEKCYVLQFSHAFNKDGDYDVSATLTDSMWDASNDSVVVSTPVKINHFLKLFGNFYILNNGPVLKGYNVTFVLMAENLVPQVTIRFNPASGVVPYSVFLQENAKLPDFVSERVRKAGAIVVDWKSYPSFTSLHGYSKSGSYLAEAVLADKVKIHSAVKVLSLEALIGKVRFFANSPVHVNRKATFVICTEGVSPNIQIDIDFGDKTLTVLKESVDKATILPPWAMEVLSKRLERVESVYRAVFEHTYSTAATYRAQITIRDKLLGDKTDYVEAFTNLDVQSLERFLGQTMFFSTSPSSLEQNVTFFLCFERFSDNISTVVYPSDGTAAIQVAVQKEHVLELLQRFSSRPIWTALCTYVGTTLHAYKTVGEYKALARVTDSQTPGDVVTMMTTVVVECRITMRLDVGNYGQKQQTYMVDRNVFAEFFVKFDSDCSSLPAEYQWYVLSTESRIELDPSKGQEVVLPDEVVLDSAVLSIPPKVLMQPYYVIAAEVRYYNLVQTSCIYACIV